MNFAKSYYHGENLGQCFFFASCNRFFFIIFRLSSCRSESQFVFFFLFVVALLQFQYRELRHRKDDWSVICLIFFSLIFIHTQTFSNFNDVAIRWKMQNIECTKICISYFFFLLCIVHYYVIELKNFPRLWKIIYVQTHA